jgi:hypothetical protein
VKTRGDYEAEAAKYPTEDAILHAPEIRSDYERGQIIGAFHRLHADDPKSLPVPDVDEVRRAGNIRTTLTGARAKWIDLEAQLKKYGDWLPAAVEELRRLQATTLPDADSHIIDRIIRLDAQIQLGNQVLGSTQPRKEAVNHEVAGALQELNALVRKFSPDQFPPQYFLNGTTPLPVIAAALAAIETLLKK